MKCQWFILSAVLVAGGSLASCQEDLTQSYIPPRRTDLETLPLTGIVEMNYGNVSSILTTVLEVMQYITAFKHELVIAKYLYGIFEDDYCFLPERNFDNFSPANVTQNLRCDHHMMELLVLALNRSAAYEETCYSRTRANKFLRNASSILQSISQALNNLTRRQQRENCGLPSLDSLSTHQQQRCPGDAISNFLEEDRSRQSQTRRSRAATTAMPTTSHSIDPTDLSFYDEKPQEDATPTATTLTRCQQPVDKDKNQFLYMQEIWLGLYYVQVDLTQKRKCLAQ